MGGFLVLGFVIFTIGLIAGMLTIAMIPVKTDFATVFMIFVLGFMTGMITIALVLVIMNFTELTKKS